VLVEGRQPPDRFDDIGVLVHHDDRRRAEAGACSPQPVEIHDRIFAHRLRRHAGHGRAARDHGLEIVPAAADAAAMAVDQFIEGDRHGFFDDAGVVHMARHRRKAWYPRCSATEACEPFRAAAQDRRHDGDDSTLFTVVGQP
jgi:hypothetical protein